MRADVRKVASTWSTSGVTSYTLAGGAAEAAAAAAAAATLSGTAAPMHADTGIIGMSAPNRVDLNTSRIFFLICGFRADITRKQRVGRSEYARYLTTNPARNSFKCETLAEINAYLFNLVGATRLGNEVDLVEHYNHIVRQNLANHEALGGLRLDALVDVNDEKHDVDDLRAANDGANQRRVAGAVDERELHLVKRQVWMQTTSEKQRKIHSDESR